MLLFVHVNAETLVRKRNSSIGDQSVGSSSNNRPIKKARKESSKDKDSDRNKSSNSSVDTFDRNGTDDDIGDKSTRSNSPQLETTCGQSDQGNGEVMEEQGFHETVQQHIDDSPQESDVAQNEHTLLEDESHQLNSIDQVADDFVVEEQGLKLNSPVRNELVKKEEATTSATTIIQDGEADPSAVEVPAEEIGTDQNESVTNSVKRQKKKRTPSILKSLGIEVLPDDEVSPPQAGNDYQVEEAGGRRYSSNRTAAVIANSKLNTKSNVRGASVVAVGQENVTVTPAAVSKGNKKDKAKQAVAEPLEWVCCDRCSKWRKIPLSANINEGDLPEKWFCEMSTWSTQFNTCEADDEAELQDDSHIEAEVSVKIEEHVVENSVNSKSSKTRSKSKKDVEINEGNNHEGVVKREIDHARSRRGGKLATKSTNMKDIEEGQGIQTDPESAGSVTQTNWVQCNGCKKWRRVPLSIDVDALPESWFCEQNSWNPLVASCSAKQEEDETVTDVSSTPAKEKEKDKKTKVNRDSHKVSANSVVSNIFWVRCEKKDCKKWRKVPGNIDVSKFPEKWYCHMNTWNIDLATCDAPEESDNETGGDPAPASQMLAPPNQKALSYRKILFGNDGRLRLCFTDKNKNGTGIFTHLLPQPIVYAGPHDEDLEPRRKVYYWWSSVYDENGPNNNISGSIKLKTNLVEEGNRFESTYMLDSLRRMYDIPCRPPSSIVHQINRQYSHGHPKKLSKSFHLLSQLTVLQRLKAECTVIRSCFLAGSTSSMLLTRLHDMLKTCRFLNPHIDACREFMSMEILKGTLRRMEENYELEVYHTKDAQLVVCLLMSTENLRKLVTAKSCKHSKEVNKPKFGDKWAKEGYPLKLRKFFVDKNHVLNQQFHLVNVGEKGSRRQRNSSKAGNINTVTNQKLVTEKTTDITHDNDPDMSIMMEQDQEQDQRDLLEQNQELLKSEQEKESHMDDVFEEDENEEDNMEVDDDDDNGDVLGHLDTEVGNDGENMDEGDERNSDIIDIPDVVEDITEASV
jgi:hypothetical protein